MLQARQLAKRYGSKLIFRDLNFTVGPGTVAAVLGVNGAGKSTLLKIVAGLVRPTAGQVCWRESESSAALSPQWRCGLFAPDAPVYHELSVIENLRFLQRGRGERWSTERIESHLDAHEIGGRADDLAGSLSSGLRARVQLAVATVHDPSVLLLDEPSANLDSAGRKILERVVAEQRTRGITLLATNDPRDLELCDVRLELN